MLVFAARRRRAPNESTPNERRRNESSPNEPKRRRNVDYRRRPSNVHDRQTPEHDLRQHDECQ